MSSKASHRLRDENEIPYFGWDRKLTVGEIRRKLRTGGGAEWARLAAWIMREAAFPDVWIFLTPSEVYQRLTDLEPYLGRKKAFWRYILDTWHGLGAI